MRYDLPKLSRMSIDSVTNAATRPASELVAALKHRLAVDGKTLCDPDPISTFVNSEEIQREFHDSFDTFLAFIEAKSKGLTK